MNPILKNILAVIAGWLIGSTVNMALVTVGHSVFPIEGLDPNDMEALAAVMPTLSAEYFIFPFLAHALGTLTGAIVVTLLVVNHHTKFALGIGAFFLLGGIAASFMIPAPTWFVATDLILAYIPMGWLGGKMAMSLRPKTAS